MKSIYVTVLCLLSFSYVHSQTLGRQVFSSMGALNQGSALSLTFTAGESIVGTDSASPFSFILTKGFQQPDPISNGPFPVQWLEVTGNWNWADAVISWITIADGQVAGFDVEHSPDGQIFHNIGYVAASGITGEADTYQFTEVDAAHLNIPVRYYRVKQIDLDGQFAYSPTVSLLGKSNTGMKASIYPNPAQESITVSYRNGARMPVIFGLYDISGKQIMNQEWTDEVGTRTLEIGNLTKGIYIIRLTSEVSVFHQRISII